MPIYISREDQASHLRPEALAAEISIRRDPWRIILTAYCPFAFNPILHDTLDQSRLIRAAAQAPSTLAHCGAVLPLPAWIVEESRDL